MCISGLTFFSWSCDLLDGKIPEVLWKLLGVTVAPYLYFLVFGMMLWYHRDTVIPKAERFRWLLLVGYVCWKLCENTFRFPHALDGVLYNTVTTLLLALLIAALGFCGKGPEHHRPFGTELFPAAAVRRAAGLWHRVYVFHRRMGVRSLRRNALRAADKRETGETDLSRWQTGGKSLK